MEQDRLDELTELRFRHFERFSSAMFESQQEMMRLLTENTKALVKLDERMGNIETRMDDLEKRAEKMEEMLTLVLDDLAFIKNHLQRRD